MSNELQLRIMLDSGAFSAWHRGDEIDLAAYIEYIKRQGHLFYSYVSLDVIPGANGRMDRSTESIRKSAEASYRNHQVMRDAGLSPIPVFHQGEEWHWLERMIDDGEPYIGVSPYLRSNIGDLIKWLDQCFTRLTVSRGRPIAKTHGFGATGHTVITRYPWHTVDSTSWAIAPGYGLIKVPMRADDGGFDYARPAMQVCVTDARPPEDVGTRHIDVLAPAEVDHVAAFLDGLGLTPTDVRTSLDCRRAAYIGYLQGLEASAGPRLFRHRRAAFGLAPRRGGAEFGFNLVFASLLRTAPQNSTLNKCGATCRLLSYYELREDGADEGLERYLKYGHGAVYEYVRRPAKQRWGSDHYKEFRRYALASRGIDEQEAIA